METESKNKILGAFVVGLALVGGAYIVANFNTPEYTQPAAVAQATPPPRSAIVVTDSDNNGIEDWRDEFVTTEPIIITETTSADQYEAPDTLTGQAGVNFFQRILEARIYSQNPNAQEEAIENTVEQLDEETSGVLYDTRNITIISNWSDADIRNYANVMGGSITANNVDGLESELVILQDILANNNTERLEELKLLGNYYRQLTNEALGTPVPAPLAKEHLDLINTYHAIAIDIGAMEQAISDPIVTLLRMRRYEDNALGLRLALENTYKALLEYNNLFVDTDPALIFNQFAPEQRI